MVLTDQLDPATARADASEVNSFLRASRFAAYQQDRVWAAVAPHNGRHDFLLWQCRDGDDLVAAAIVRRTWLGPRHWLATLQRGPIVHDPVRLPQALERLIARLDAAGCCSVQLAPRVRGRDLPGMAEALRGAGFAPLDADRQPLHHATGIVWLDKPEDAVFAGFRQRGRRQVRAAIKAGVTVRPVETDADIDAYQAMLDAFRLARRDYDMSGLPDARGQNRLIGALGGAMMLAECEGRTIGAHAFVRQGDEAIWLSLATDDSAPDVPRAYALLWEGMRRAREMGAIGYDLAGIPVGEPRDPGEANRWQFKSAFAPTTRIMPPMQLRAIKPAAHLMLFGAREIYRGLKRRRLIAA